MSKRNRRCLSFLLVFSILVPLVSVADDLVGLKNLSWEEQKNRTRIILETTQPLHYTMNAVEGSTDVQVELQNLDLRNLPQELFINTSEVVSLQTFPQADQQKSKIVVKMTSVRPHQVTADGNNLYIDIGGSDAGDAVASPVAAAPVPANNSADAAAGKATPSDVAKPAEHSATPVTEPAQVAASQKPASAPAQMADQATSPATEVRDLRIDAQKGSADVVLVGNGSFQYDVFELSNPQRIVVDLKSVSIAPGVKNVVASGNEYFSKVRLGQYQTSPKVARAVIDLTQKAPYSIVRNGRELRVHVGSQAAQAEETTPAAIAESDTSEPASTQPAPSEPVATAAAPAPEKLEPVAMASAEVKPSVDVPSPSVAAQPQTPGKDNEQFFSFKPDTSLFAQDTAETGGTGTTAESPSVGGMGSFETKTISSGEKQYTGEPFSFDFKDIDIKDLFRFIADISGLNVILDPSVKGSVTLKLTEVPWDQALDLITKNQGLGYTIEGNVIRIAPLSKIAAEEQARAQAQRQQMLNAPIVTKLQFLSYAKAQEVDKVVKKLLTQKGSSIVDLRTNTLIITDINTNIDPIVNLIQTLDTRTPQVLIEARIVETTKNYAQAFGIQWGFRGIVDPGFGNNTTLQFPNNALVNGGTLGATSGITGNPLGGYAVNLPTNSAPNSAILLSAGNILDTFRLDLALMALESTGNGRIISSPKVAAQNNTPAEILQGTQIPVQTIANNTITTSFTNAALRMKVTPQITAEGTIIMELEVENNRPDLSFVTIAQPTPGITTERATTTLLVEDGGTTVIGGIFTASDQYAQGRTPVLHRIPLLGWLFKNTNISRENRELLIFLTPRILR